MPAPAAAASCAVQTKGACSSALCIHRGSPGAPAAGRGACVLAAQGGPRPHAGKRMGRGVPLRASAWGPILPWAWRRVPDPRRAATAAVPPLGPRVNAGVRLPAAGSPTPHPGGCVARGAPSPALGGAGERRGPPGSGAGCRPGWCCGQSSFLRRAGRGAHGQGGRLSAACHPAGGFGVRAETSRSWGGKALRRVFCPQTLGWELGQHPYGAGREAPMGAGHKEPLCCPRPRENLLGRDIFLPPPSSPLLSLCPFLAQKLM